MSDFLAGICVGFSQVLSGHPLDTIKVLIQNGHKWSGFPIKEYYRGWRYPLVSSIFFNFTAFPIYERSKFYLDSSFLAGCCSGMFVGPIAFVFDVGKIKKQTNQNMNLKILVQNNGFPLSASREILAMGFYFGTYNYLKDSGFNSFIAGAAGGLANWSLTYPIDVIRSRQIACNISIKDSFTKGNLWKGYTACALRAKFVNGISFTVYENVKNVKNVLDK